MTRHEYFSSIGNTVEEVWRKTADAYWNNCTQISWQAESQFPMKDYFSLKKSKLWHKTNRINKNPENK